MGHVDPLRGFEVKEVSRGKRDHNPMRIVREAIELAQQQAAKPHVGGRRHSRHPLTEPEAEHHAKVDRYLGRSRA